MINSMDAEKAFDKIQHASMIYTEKMMLDTFSSLKKK